MTNTQLRDLALAVLSTEAKAVEALQTRIDEHFEQACRHMLACKGRIVVTGMGKSGHIGGKLAATLASTGAPAFFMHPGEAGHGDLGMITADDVVIALSNSGETGEILTILPLIKRLGVPLIAMTGRPQSTLAAEATVNIDVSVEKEACPLGLAPTASTTAALAMGDALAVALLDSRGFTKKDFALSHPGGSLGRRLLLHVEDIMHAGDELPRIQAGAMVRDALIVMTRCGLGMTTVIDDCNRLRGILTDGDLRRALDREIDVHHTPVTSVMTRDPHTIDRHELAAEALHRMQTHKINALIVTTGNNADQPIVEGVLNMHDLLRAGVV